MTVPAFTLLAPKNNSVDATIAGSLGAGDTAIALTSGHGASYMPSISRGSATSTGDARTLNDTGDLGSVAVGDYIYNLTDASWAVVVDISSAPNSIRTSPLEGGSDNTWTSGDVWVIGLFVATLAQFDVSGTVLKRERVLVTNRVTDTLTVVRGHDGDTPQSFDALDSIQILVEENQVEELHKAVRNIIGKIDALHRGIPFTATTTGSSNAYAATIGITVTDYADLVGVPLTLISNFGNTGASTLNINGLGAKNIYKGNGATALTTDNIASAQLFTVVYDGTQFQLQSPSATSDDAPPTGSVMPYAAETAPSGWLLCDGSAVSRTTYSALHTLLKDVGGTDNYAYGNGDGSTTFNVPDLRGRFPLGQDNMGGASADRVTDTEADSVGSSEGQESVSIAHNHTKGSQTTSNSNPSDGTAAPAGSTGGMSANDTPNLMNPYITVTYIIKT